MTLLGQPAQVALSGVREWRIPMGIKHLQPSLRPHDVVVALELEPAGHHVVTWRMTTPSREPVAIRVTPGVDSGGGPVELPAC